MSTFELSLLNLKGASKPLTKLIEVVSKGIGELYRPLGTVIQAHADAKAVAIQEKANGVKNELAWRASARLNFLELRRQENIDSIIKSAIEVLPTKVSKEPVDEDWVVNFFESCKDIGDEAMQQIWGKILAGEVEKPGRFSRRTFSMLKTISKKEANMFTRFCSFIVEIEPDKFYMPIPPHQIFQYIRNNGMSAEEENHLKHIGLLSTVAIYYPFEEKLPLHVRYFENKYRYGLSREIDEDTGCDIEYFPLTQCGNELAPIAGGKIDSKYINLLCEIPDPVSGVVLRKIE